MFFVSTFMYLNKFNSELANSQAHIAIKLMCDQIVERLLLVPKQINLFGLLDVYRDYLYLKSFIVDQTKESHMQAEDIYSQNTLKLADSDMGSLKYVMEYFFENNTGENQMDSHNGLLIVISVAEKFKEEKIKVKVV
jgi:hypothetical protein